MIKMVQEQGYMNFLVENENKRTPLIFNDNQSAFLNHLYRLKSLGFSILECMQLESILMTYAILTPI